MIPYNFHTHTPRCQHAYGSEREYIEKAISVGMKTLGFSDHCPVPFKNGYVSKMRMTMDEAPEYVETIRKLAEEYASQIKILVGFEMEYFPQYFEEQIKFFDSLGIDYLILGQHFLYDEAPSAYTGNPTSNPQDLKDYVKIVTTGMKTGKFKYLCHPDVLNFTGDQNLFLEEMYHVCVCAKQLNIPLEVNGLGTDGHRNYPNPAFWNLAQSVGNTAIVGMDVHKTELMTNQAVYDKCQNLIISHNLPLADIDKVFG
ncbi:MAG: histidinol-phosphatase [Alphaproteobacteria bacterium]|nr:histidinol-phosphatase [Alphaproteobacteria bacterium]